MYKALHELVGWIDDIFVTRIDVFSTSTIVRQRSYEAQTWDIPVVFPHALLEYL